MRLLLLIALSVPMFASQEGYCKSLNQRFDQRLEAADVAHEFGDDITKQNQFALAKALFYEAVVGGCGRYIDMPAMKETLSKAYVKYEKKEEVCIK